MTQSKMNRGGTKQVVMINKSTSCPGVVQELAFPSHLPQQILPTHETLGNHGFGILMDELWSPCRVEKTFGTKNWGWCLLGHCHRGDGGLYTPCLLHSAGCAPPWCLACLTAQSRPELSFLGMEQSRNSHNVWPDSTPSAAISPAPTIQVRQRGCALGAPAV